MKRSKVDNFAIEQTTLVLFFMVLYMKSQSSQAIQHAAVSNIKASSNISYKQR